MNFATQPIAERLSNPKSQGLAAGICANLVWGLLPLYWAKLRHIPPTQLMAHRILWAMLVVAILGPWPTYRRAYRTFRESPRAFFTTGVAAALMASNWLVYIWAVGSGRVLEASLGYFIGPFLSVLLGCVFLKERLSRGQVVALGIAASGVVYLIAGTQRPPWVGLWLGTTFAAYGMSRKKAQFRGIEGFIVDVSLLAPFALAYLAKTSLWGISAFDAAPSWERLMLVGSGVVSALPLLLFCRAAQSLSLTVLGLVQYIMPTLQFILAVLVFGETFGRPHAVCFAAIWTALVLFGLSPPPPVKKEVAA